MSTATLAAPPIAVPVAVPVAMTVRPARPGDVDNRGTYISFGLTYVLGHGASALATGVDPLVDLPGWLPMAVLYAGLGVGSVVATRAALKSQVGASRPELLSGRLLGLSWVIAFGALFLGITGFASTLDRPDLPGILMPTLSGLVVGLIYLAEGAVRRNVLHYGLGTWLALVSTAALFFDAPGMYGVLAVAGGAGYAVATVLERRRLR